MITSRIAKDAPKNVDELWESIQRGFWAIPDDSLDNLFHQKTVACAQIAEREGAHVQNDKHTGYRRVKNMLGRPPTWAEMRQHCNPDKRWIYEYEVPKPRRGRKRKCD